jgi:flagellar assembly factor FliW
MSEEEQDNVPTIVVKSSRFGDLTVPEDSVIELPSGMIGFPRFKSYIMLDHSPPFSWLQSLDSPDLAFVVMDGAEFGEGYSVKPPKNDPDIDLKDDDEFAILVIVTVRPTPTDTTANLKAPLFVNIRNRKGIQVIFDDPNLTTRYPLYSPEDQEKAKEGESAAETKDAAAESSEKEKK